MKKVVRLTESDLVRIVKRVMIEQTNNTNPIIRSFEQIVKPALLKAGFKMEMGDGDNNLGNNLGICFATPIISYYGPKTTIEFRFDCKTDKYKVSQISDNQFDYKYKDFDNPQEAVTHALKLKSQF